MARARGPAVASLAALAALLASCGSSEPAGGACPAGSGSAPVASVEVVERFPHDAEAFTQGLVYHDGRLYESTGRLGESSVREVELESGRVIRHRNLEDEYFGEGLALLDERLYQLTWRHEIGFVYRSSDLAELDTFRFDGEGWGLTTDGASLILSDGSSRLRYLDRGTFRVTRTVDVTDGGEPVIALNELEWVDGEVWANVWDTDRVARVDPSGGRVLGWIDLTGLLSDDERAAAGPGGVPNGIAYDAAARRVFVTGKLWPALFEVAVTSAGSPAATPRCE